MYKLIMLDLDGTLADSAAGIAASINGALARGDYPLRPASEITPLIGLPLHVMFERLLPPTDYQAIPVLITAYREIHVEHMASTQLFPGVADSLRRLKQAGLLLSIATSKLRPTAQLLLDLCAIGDLFDLVMGNDCVTQLKPAPEMLHRTLEALGCQQHEALMVGDSIYDMEMGYAAGVATCAVTYGVSGSAALQAMRPTFTIDRFSDLLPIALGPEA